MARCLSEQPALKEMIDPQLEMTGWYFRHHSKLKIQTPIDSYSSEVWNGVSDDYLYSQDGEALAADGVFLSRPFSPGIP